MARKLLNYFRKWKRFVDPDTQSVSNLPETWTNRLPVPADKSVMAISYCMRSMGLSRTFNPSGCWNIEWATNSANSDIVIVFQDEQHMFLVAMVLL
jgi:hypothetical protein